MSVYTSFALILGRLVGSGVGYYYFKGRSGRAIEKAINEKNCKGFHTLKSEGDDQPKKETVLQIEGKEDVLKQPAVSSSIPKKKKRRKKKKSQKKEEPKLIEEPLEEPTEEIEEEIKEVIESNQ